MFSKPVLIPVEGSKAKSRFTLGPEDGGLRSSLEQIPVPEPNSMIFKPLDEVEVGEVKIVQMASEGSEKGKREERTKDRISDSYCLARFSFLGYSQSGLDLL